MHFAATLLHQRLLKCLSTARSALTARSTTVSPVVELISPFPIFAQFCHFEMPRKLCLGERWGCWGCCHQEPPGPFFHWQRERRLYCYVADWSGKLTVMLVEGLSVLKIAQSLRRPWGHLYFVVTVCRDIVEGLRKHNRVLEPVPGV